MAAGRRHRLGRHAASRCTCRSGACLAVFVRDHVQTARGSQQFAGAQQELRIRRRPNFSLPTREGFVKQQAALGHAADDGRHQRAPQVVGDDHRVEAPSGQRPRAGLEIGLDHSAASPCETASASRSRSTAVTRRPRAERWRT